MKFIKTLLASVAFVAFASSAYAAPVLKDDLGLIVNTIDIDENASGTFTDVFNFSLNVGAADFSGSKIVLGSTRGGIRYDFSDLTLSVFSGVYVDGDLNLANLLGTLDINTSADFGNEFTLNALTGSNYYVAISGTATGASGGIYALSITPVPEPSSVAMLLIGFAALGAVARRRKTL